MKTFEYHIERFSIDFDPEVSPTKVLARLNALGADGWELWQLLGQGSILFKRDQAEPGFEARDEELRRLIMSAAMRMPSDD
jgi:hypothetical protein